MTRALNHQAIRAVLAAICVLCTAVVGSQPVSPDRAAGPPLYRVINLGTLGGEASGASALNRHGDVVGWSLDRNGLRRAFVYRNGMLTDIGTLPGGTESSATGINDQGQVIGYSGINEYGNMTTEVSQAFLWDNGVMQAQGALYCPCTFNTRYGISVAQDINNRVIATGWSETVRGRSVFHAFVLDNQGMQDIGGGAGNWSVSRAYAINDQGSVVGEFAREAGRLSAYDRSAVHWSSDGTMTILQTPAGHTSSTARDINERNQIVGWSWTDRQEDSPARAVMWDSDGVHDLGTLSGYEVSRARGINDSARIVGWSGTADRTISRAVVWSDGVMTDLNERLAGAEGWVLTEACAINDAGQIVGTGLYQGKPRAFLLQPLPVPLAQQNRHPLLRAIRHRLR